MCPVRLDILEESKMNITSNFLVVVKDDDKVPSKQTKDRGTLVSRVGADLGENAIPETGVLQYSASFSSIRHSLPTLLLLPKQTKSFEELMNSHFIDVHGV